MGSEHDRIGPGSPPRRTPAARASQALTEARRATQDELATAARKHSTAAGERQAPLAMPLTEAELSHPRSEGYIPAITDVDCTPRPRYGESQAKFLVRMTSYGLDMQALKADIRQRNRAAALRTGTWPEGGTYYFTQCACKWCGLRVADPEVARREYDAHACAAETIGDDVVSRAQAHAGKATMPAKRTMSVLKPALAQPPVDEIRPAKQDLDDLDEASQRFALLELGKP